MSQSRTVCPRCQRAPGRAHSEACPRSRGRLAALSASLTKPPRLLWKKGALVFRNPLWWLKGNVTTIDNPGIPRVVHGSNPWAGGFPRGKRRESAEFLVALGIETKP